MKNFFDSVANRVFLILLAGVLVAAGTTSWLADNERRNAFKELYDFRIAERVEQIVLSLDGIRPEMRAAVLETSENFGLQASLAPNTENVMPENASLVALLRARLGNQRQIVVSKQVGCNWHPDRPPGPYNQSQRNRPRIDECEVVYVSLKDGALLKLKLRVMRDPGGLRGRPLGMPTLSPYFALFLGLIAMLAYLVAKMTARPIKRLAEAASALGRDIDRPPLVESGPTEIRQAASAFNAMQARIKRQIQHRTHMLAAITHDLQTPLTRLRLRFEKVSDLDLRHKLIEDLAVMQSMVREGLDLARSMDSAEAMQLLDIDSLLDSVCADAADAGQDVVLKGQTRASIMAQPNALRRCLTNLVDNAVKYGRYARLQIVREGAGEHSSIVITVRDGGAGIPEDQLTAVFEPFFRLETSRSRDTGGTGLGLTIARNIAENHRAVLTLRNHPEGGLEVVLRLPGNG
ncbi:ATP-binding protein [Glaciimonas immobilis]|uniref:histidine kinase n=1 Tax=Glaciimonas immobilis TaxID=728004 RepID=A0A840RY05_9BURK|nr:ATP-binding protein [Glaciimonas immobilis]KAF3998410.1 HAMP domain-containing protein [Glaciimonas immobilis]MBB5202102.1 signal transduction histidine kinase [Glaciimonas immobilis]